MYRLDRKAKASFFRALGDETRLEILERLRKKGEMGVSDICENLHKEQSVISHHLACLKNCGLVSSKRRGKQIFYSLNGQERISKILQLGEKHVSATLEGILRCEVVG